VRKKAKPKADKPDEVFEAAGIRMERRGRFTSIETHRTREEQKQLLERVVKSRPKLLEDIQKATEDLMILVHRFNSLELLAQVWFNNSVGDPNDYKEYSFEGRPPYVEHLAVLELKDREYKVHTMEMPGGADIEKAQGLLETIFNRTLFYYGSEPFDPEQIGHLSRLDRLRFDTIMHELVIRSPTYFAHHADVLQEVFGRGFIKEWMLAELGFDINQALTFVQATSDLMMKRLVDRRNEATDFVQRLRTYVSEFKKTGRFSGPPDLKEAVNQIRNMRGKEAKRTIQGIAVSWTFYNLHETCSFTALELAEQSRLDANAAEAFLSKFSLQFGDTPTDYLLPRPTSPIRLRPIIRYGEKYFCPTSHLLIWALKPQIELLLKPGGPARVNADTKLWERYQKYRSDSLMRRALMYFRDLLPRAEVYGKLQYTVIENGVEKVAELDGLVLFDRYIFLIEGKAGAVSPSTRRGGQLRLVADLKELVEEPHRQALRASAYIASTERPMFQLENGAKVCVDKAIRQQFFMITLTLENLDVFTKELYQLKELGIFGASELPWAVSIDDLRIIAETIKVPAQFIHYLKWRLHLNHEIKIVAQSELDWLGYYLAERPQLLTVPEGYDNVMLQTYTTEFDDFYLYEQGERTVAAPRPSQFCPAELMNVLMSIEATARDGSAAVSEALLDLSFEERKLLASHIRQLSRSPGKGDREQIKFEGERTAVVLKTGTGGAEGCGRLAESVAKEKSKTTAVLVLTTEPKLTEFGIYEIPRAKPS
jgi:hypothetical protein